MDSQIDVALHTLVQIAPEHLYYHVRVVETLVWEPWLAESEAQFCLLLMVRFCVASTGSLRLLSCCTGGLSLEAFGEGVMRHVAVFGVVGLMLL